MNEQIRQPEVKVQSEERARFKTQILAEFEHTAPRTEGETTAQNRTSNIEQITIA
jgi:hypothetical protein